MSLCRIWRDDQGSLGNGHSPGCARYRPAIEGAPAPENIHFFERTAESNFVCWLSREQNKLLAVDSRRLEGGARTQSARRPGRYRCRNKELAGARTLPGCRLALAAPPVQLLSPLHWISAPRLSDRFCFSKMALPVFVR